MGSPDNQSAERSGNTGRFLTPEGVKNAIRTDTRLSQVMTPEIRNSWGSLLKTILATSTPSEWKNAIEMFRDRTNAFRPREQIVLLAGGSNPLDDQRKFDFSIIDSFIRDVEAFIATAPSTETVNVIPTLEDWTNNPPETLSRLKSVSGSIDTLPETSDDFLNPKNLTSRLDDVISLAMRFEQVYRLQSTSNPEDKLKKLDAIDAEIKSAEKVRDEKILAKWKVRIQTVPSLAHLITQTNEPIPATIDAVNSSLVALDASLASAKGDVVFAELPNGTYIDYLKNSYFESDTIKHKKEELLKRWIDLQKTSPDAVALSSYVTTLRNDFIVGTNEITPAEIAAAEAELASHLAKVSLANGYSVDQVSIWTKSPDFAGGLEVVITEMKEKLAKTIESKKAVDEIRLSIDHVESETLNITSNSEKIVDNAYKPLLDRILALRREGILNKEVLDTVERDVHLSKYKILWRSFDTLMDDVVGKNLIGSSEFTLIEKFVLPSMETSAKRLSEVYVPAWDTLYPEDPTGRSGRENFYLDELQALKDHWEGRKLNNFTWHYIQGSVLTKGVRKIPDVANTSSEDELPFRGIDDYTLTCKGQFRYEHAKQSNYALGTRWHRRLPNEEDYDIVIGPDPTDASGRKRKIVKMELKPGVQLHEDPKNPGNFYVEESFTETAAGFFKRFYDQVYRGDLVLYDASGDKLSVATLHDRLDFLTDRAYEAVNKVLGVDVKTTPTEAKVPRRVAKELLRESSFVTFHQSDLTHMTTTGTSDEWYYITHYDEYAEGYIEDQMGFSKYIKRFFIGDKASLPLEDVKEGYTKSVGEVVDDDFRRLSEKKKQERLKKIGFSSFKFLHRAPLIRPVNVAVGYSMDSSTRTPVRREEKRTFETPLSSMAVKGKKRLIKDGKLGRVMTMDDRRAYGEYKKKDERVNSNNAHYWDHMKLQNGVIIDDRITSGDNRFFLEGDEYPYELIAEKDMRHVEGQFVFNYVKNLSSGPLPLYKNVLGNSQQEAVNKIIGVDFIKELRKEGKYLFPLLGGVGFLHQTAEIIPGVKEDIEPLEIEDNGVMRMETESEAKARFKKAVAYQVSDVLILAVCDIMTGSRTKKDKRWSVDQVYEYLQDLFENDAITQDEAVMLYLATVHGRHLDMFFNKLGQDIETQVRDLFKYRK